MKSHRDQTLFVRVRKCTYPAMVFVYSVARFEAYRRGFGVVADTPHMSPHAAY